MRRIIGCILLGLVFLAITALISVFMSYDLAIPLAEAVAWTAVIWIGIALFGAMIYGIATLIFGGKNE